jgi:hypothetical protein
MPLLSSAALPEARMAETQMRFFTACAAASPDSNGSRIAPGAASILRWPNLRMVVQNTQ